LIEPGEVAVVVSTIGKDPPEDIRKQMAAKVRAHLLKYHVDVVNVLICHIHLPEESMKTQT
jgi:hypothetical protein